jgi:hypothetical protein
MGARAELCCSIQEFELLSFHRFLLNKLKKREKKTSCEAKHNPNYVLWHQ